MVNTLEQGRRPSFGWWKGNRGLTLSSPSTKKTQTGHRKQEVRNVASIAPEPKIAWTGPNSILSIFYDHFNNAFVSGNRSWPHHVRREFESTCCQLQFTFVNLNARLPSSCWLEWKPIPSTVAFILQTSKEWGWINPPHFHLMIDAHSLEPKPLTSWVDPIK